MTETTRFKPMRTRRYLLRRQKQRGKIVRYLYRPFDLRWLYWDPETKLLDEKRADYEQHVNGVVPWIEARQRQPKTFDRGYVTVVLADNFGSGLSTFFPLSLNPTASAQQRLVEVQNQNPPQTPDGRNLNLSDQAVDYLQGIGTIEGEEANLFHHTVAILHAPAYREENAGALRQDWPRVPLPTSPELLSHSAGLGQLLSDLLNPEVLIAGVTSGGIRSELRVIGTVQKTSHRQIDPGAGDLAVTAGWGYSGARGVTMPGRGRLEERPYTAEERVALQRGAAALGLPTQTVLDLLGEKALDVYLNDDAYWRCIPLRVWEYTLGGYQVLKKWLSYREQDLLGRPLKAEEAREVTNITRRIAAILLVTPELDDNYDAVSNLA